MFGNRSGRMKGMNIPSTPPISVCQYDEKFPQVKIIEIMFDRRNRGMNEIDIPKVITVFLLVHHYR